MLHWCITNLHYDIDYILWHLSLLHVVLMIRQEKFIANNGKGFNLSDIEFIESGEFDR